MSVIKKLAAPLRAYFNPRFDAITARLTEIEHRIDRAAELERELSAQERIDVGEVNVQYAPAPFSSFASQAVSAAHFDEPEFARWFALVHDGGMRFHRKAWEWAFVLERAQRGGVLHAGSRAAGFGVGGEPIPAVLAANGVDVLATDQAPEDAGHWAASGEHAAELAALSHPEIVDDETLSQRVRLAAFDMNDPLDDLGTFDFVWSSCAIEHLGSPEKGMDFVLRSVEVLNPGGIAVHTTELELTRRAQTVDHGHCAVYRPSDLERLAREVQDAGCVMDLNLHVSMAAPEDRYVALAPYPANDPSHLKLEIFDSVSTSFGIAIKRPERASG